MYLTNSQMAEATDEFCLVKGVSGHLHPAHGLHLLVHPEKLVAGDLNVKVRLLAFVGVEGVLVKFDGERLGGVRRRLFELSRVSGSLNGA